jgi:hypothetical protein
MAADPNSVRTPAVRFRSLIAVGTPYSGEDASPIAAVARAACRRARSPVTVTKAPTESESRATRAR